ncbi:ABC-type Fe3+/spermidine/putrescine transport system ATPase subunit [Chitinophaga niastensis]|uniref:ABC-type Fe3+/spermidine/putrescine transport system ATPase subunit n=1 Tax=Chitinophaga niastensis TaxID=536980 RepID=A0A2P8HF10_CHINA|nr:ABC transporter ATP-binding protein [Chitinophaga niastensis]PSL44774.1 ABC-type Fe3+/spermidine/putrescine transport system ATPase subunit [Chitinophaga niastensis]
MDFLKVSNISKQQQGVFIVKDVSFTQQQFQKMVIAGETGSGKSTLMKTIGGLSQPDAGTVLFENVRVEGPLEVLIPGQPGTAYLSQHFELRNNYRVEEILSYANKLSDEDAAEIYAICRISHLLKRKTDQVSGGEKQRIAMARLLISAPRLFLLDEPYSNLDMIHKSILKGVINDIGEQLGITCMLISHDPLDILPWADEILVMKEGEIVQQGTPQQIYNQPVNEYVARLFGKYNLITPARSGVLAGLPGIALNGKNIFIRPEDFRVVSTPGEALTGKVNQLTFFGSYTEMEVLLAEDIITVKTAISNMKKGDTVHVAVAPDAVWYF